MKEIVSILIALLLLVGAPLRAVATVEEDLHIAYSYQLRDWWSDYLGAPEKYVDVPFPGENGEVWNLAVAAPMEEAWLAFTNVMRAYGYEFRESAGGTYNFRHIGNDPSRPWSNHAYGIAVDLNPSANPYDTHRNDFPDGFVEAVKEIEVDGQQAFRWGGDWPTPDPMHFDANLAPEAYEQGEVTTLSVLTREQQEQLADLLDRLAEIGSSVAYVSYMVPWFRRLSGLDPAALEELEESDEIAALDARIDELSVSSTDAVARRSAEAAHSRIDSIGRAARG